ncbi:hypothetical protein CYY_001150 [Polysphondylium violaceum]|uniref:BAR domain-containing protein n=1 Tax=Polysphondylium violaceum TaxID=133409 RepID=A0A8J4Q3K6_9MYCE|nr:hypothetical protein CYY_001150 [Polysphondylium violaceum]
MFKNVLNKTKEAARSVVTEVEAEPEVIQNSKASLKNMKWSLKLLIQLARGYYLASDKQVTQGAALAGIFQKFGEQCSHSNYTVNQTMPLSVSLMEVGEGVKQSSIYFQQYTQIFCDKMALQLENLYKQHVKKVSNLAKQQEEIRIKYNSANNGLKSAQKNNTTGTKLAEKTTEYETSKSHYETVSANLVQAVKEMVEYVQKEVALAIKQFVQEQQLMVQECIKMWISAENKLFSNESPAITGQQYQQPPPTSYENSPVNLDKLSIHETSPPPQPYGGEQQYQPQQDQYYQPEPSAPPPVDEYQPPQQTSPNPFDQEDSNPFDLR